jgi:flagellin
VDNSANTEAIDVRYYSGAGNTSGVGYLDAGFIKYDTYDSSNPPSLTGGGGGGAAKQGGDIRLLVGTSVTGGNIISVSRRDMRCRSLGLNGVDMRTTAGAYAALDPIKQALTRVSEARSYFGAVQNRLEHTIANLKNVVENTAAAESRIRDTDMATEMAAFANNNVVKSAAEAMLAQANTTPEMVLRLLG